MNAGGRAPSPRERDRVIEALCEHYARDRFELPELERRLDRASRAGDVGELESLLADLPALEGGAGEGRTPGRAALPGAGGGSGRGLPVRGDPDGETSLRAGGGRVEASRVPSSQLELAVWSGRARAGNWIPARRIRVLAFMGGVELDFREALFGPEPVEVHVGALMGGVEIIVPPGVHVDTGGFAFMGAFEEQLEGGDAAGPDAPVIRVTGFAMMGSVEIVTRLPGESARDTRRRRKEEARRRRDLERDSRDRARGRLRGRSD